MLDLDLDLVVLIVDLSRRDLATRHVDLESRSRNAPVDLDLSRSTTTVVDLEPTVYSFFVVSFDITHMYFAGPAFVFDAI